MQSSNYDQTLKDRGLSAPNALKDMYDINPGFGGPIKKDALWFFVTVRATNPVNYVAGDYPNRNAGKQDVWIYEADMSQPQGTSEQFFGGAVRLTWQAAAQHKFGLYYADKFKCQGGIPSGQGCHSVTPTLSSDAIGYAAFDPFWDLLVEWSSPVTSRLLLEAAVFHHNETWGQLPAPTTMVDPGLEGVTLQAAPPRANDYDVSRSRGPYDDATSDSEYSIAPCGFVCDRCPLVQVRRRSVMELPSWLHVLEHTVQLWLHDRGHPGVAHAAGCGVEPNRIYSESRVSADGGAFAQDRWTSGRLTLAGGLRLDWFKAYLPEQHIGPSTLTPNRNITSPKYETLDWKDLTPKMGAAYDVFGTGRTALKVSLGKYVLGQAGVAGNGLATAGPATTVTQATRGWSDIDRDFVPDCDLVSLAANGECGQVLNQAFGSQAPATRVDLDVKEGWNKRQYSWELGVSAQHSSARTSRWTAASIGGGSVISTSWIIRQCRRPISRRSVSSRRAIQDFLTVVATGSPTSTTLRPTLSIDSRLTSRHS